MEFVLTMNPAEEQIPELKGRIAELEKNIESLGLALRETQAALKSQTVFLANMSHELRTPLNAILNYSEMLLEDAEDRGTQRERTI